MSQDEFADVVANARRQFSSLLGTPDQDLLAPVINPAFEGGPEWPGFRQGWAVIRKPGCIRIMSDGLSDPYADDDEEGVGLGFEILVESPDQFEQEVQNTWLFDLAFNVSQQCADLPQIRGLIENLGVLLLELPVTEKLSFSQTEEDSIGVLLGVLAPDIPATIQLPNSDIRIVGAKLLWPSEISFAATGNEARQKLAQLFSSSGQYHISSAHRKRLI